MDLQTYLREKRGRTQTLARALGVSPSLVTQWAGGKPVATKRCTAIERATAGVVSRQDLRPEDWREVWPELAAAHEKELEDRGAITAST